MASIAALEVTIGLPLRFQRGELLEHAEFSARATQALRDARSPDDLLRTLAADGDPRDLALALAFLMPKRQAVWWACLAARLGLAPQPSATDFEALRCAEAWVQSGAEEWREQAEAAAEACGHDGPASWAATAAFWSGQSIGPRGQPLVPPKPHLTAIAVRAVLLLSALSDHARASMAEFCDIGLAILAGQDGRAEFDRIAARDATRRAGA